MVAKNSAYLPPTKYNTSESVAEILSILSEGKLLDKACHENIRQILSADGFFSLQIRRILNGAQIIGVENDGVRICDVLRPGLRDLQVCTAAESALQRGQ